MPTNKQRRDAARRKLERQLEARQARARRRRRANIIASALGAIVVVAVVVVVIVVSNRGNDKSTASSTGTPTAPTAPTSPGATTPSATPSVKYPAASGAAVTFNGVTIKGAADLKGKPAVTSKASTDPTKLQYKDLVVGKGAVAKPTSTVDVQYVGVLYKNGKAFDNSWDRGMPAEFPLTGVVPGFTQGIGGTTGVPAMKVGGRRVIIVPAALGYKDQASGSIPANSTLVFVIDLTQVKAGTPAG